MTEYTTNYKLEKQQGNDYINIDWINNNFDVIDSGVKMIDDRVGAVSSQLGDYTKIVPYAGTSTGTANTYIIATPTIIALTAGMAVCLKFNLDSTAASTLNWCGLGAKAIKKANGTSPTNLKATGIYTLRYDGTSFILQGEGASGTAIASDLLLGKTATTDAGDITGTITSKAAATITPGTADQTIASGQYLSGAQTIKGDADLIPSNIKSGVDIFGIVGSMVQGKKFAIGTVVATAGICNVLLDKWAYNICAITLRDSVGVFTRFYTYKNLAMGVVNGAASQAILTVYISTGTGNGVICTVTKSTTTSEKLADNYSIANGGALAVSASGFTLPCNTVNSGTVLNWIALE